MLRLRGGKWYFQCKIDGKSFQRSTGQTDRRKAEKEADRLLKLVRLRKGTRCGPLTVSRAATAEIARLEGDVSRQQAWRAVCAFKAFQTFAGDVPLDRVTPDLIERYQRERLRTKARATVDKELCLVLRMLRNNGVEIRRPGAKRGKVTQQRPFTQDELTRFFEACPERHRTLYLTLLATGARFTELMPSKQTARMGVLKSEVDLEGRRLTIRTAKARTGEPCRERNIPIPVWLVEPLRERMEAVKGEQVFPFEYNMRRTFEAILEAAGIDKVDALGRKVTSHSFRHTFASLLRVQTGGDPFVMKAALGHSRISTTDIYTHVDSYDIPEPTGARIIDLSAARGAKSGCQEEEKPLGMSG